MSVLHGPQRNAKGCPALDAVFTATHPPPTPTFLSVDDVASRPGTAGQKLSAHVALSCALSRYSDELPAPCGRQQAAGGRPGSRGGCEWWEGVAGWHAEQGMRLKRLRADLACSAVLSNPCQPACALPACPPQPIAPAAPHFTSPSQPAGPCSTLLPPSTALSLHPSSPPKPRPHPSSIIGRHHPVLSGYHKLGGGVRVPGKRLHVSADLPAGHAGRVRRPHVQLRKGRGGRQRGAGWVEGRRSGGTSSGMSVRQPGMPLLDTPGPPMAHPHPYPKDNPHPPHPPPRLTRQARLSKPPDSSTGASAGFQATACTLLVWCVSVC